jgi:putative membrane protein
MLIPSVEWQWGLTPLVAVPFVALLGLLRFRDTGWAIDDSARLIACGRIVARTTTIAPRRRLQRRQVVRSPLQRRARLATFRFAVAAGGRGGHVEIEHLDEAAAFELLERLRPSVQRLDAPTAALDDPQTLEPTPNRA